mmetsp:Transcript_14174/g.35360  ORF Transcript_14174/g.35360 Transcript_14174/m.35360 type:complete len:212 (+) Transcript_14174:11-646(+)
MLEFHRFWFFPRTLLASAMVSRAQIMYAVGLVGLSEPSLDMIKGLEVPVINGGQLEGCSNVRSRSTSRSSDGSLAAERESRSQDWLRFSGRGGGGGGRGGAGGALPVFVTPLFAAQDGAGLPEPPGSVLLPLLTTRPRTSPREQASHGVASVTVRRLTLFVFSIQTVANLWIIASCSRFSFCFSAHLFTGSFSTPAILGFTPLIFCQNLTI